MMLLKNLNKINKNNLILNFSKSIQKQSYLTTTTTATNNVINKNKNNINTTEVVIENDEDEINNENYLKQYSQSRDQMMNDYKEKTGKEIYESKARKITHTIKDFRKQFNDKLENGNKLTDIEAIILAGRVKSIRISSNKLVFIDIISSLSNQEISYDEIIGTNNENGDRLNGGQYSLQVMADKKFYKDNTEFETIILNLRRGDIIEINGLPAKTKVGEISIIPREINILTPCIRPIPQKLIDKEIRYRNRPLDFLVNTSTQKAFYIRSKMISYLRRFLVEKGYLEVDTPILSTNVGGANAKPFKTHSNSLNLDLFLRISPELFLKQLIISGFDKVFEIGKQFRNEGIDLTHNPEFTTCEFYQAYADYETMMTMTEELLSGMVYDTLGTYEVPLPSNPEIKINFKGPYKRINFIDKIQELTGRQLPKDLVSYDCIPDLLDICDSNNIKCKEPYTPTRILDEMASTLLEPLCIQPTFIQDHPLAMSPLAKIHRDSSQRTERFELFVGGKELVNAYSELNDPKEQRKRFLAQSMDRTTGDEEAQILDESFCNALELALPPTGGWGLGIDRLCMLFSNTTTIKDVILFPTMKPIQQQQQQQQQQQENQQKDKKE
ncbi:hypothetical protein RB653_000268 [Dictyostelium firmibasis]|uniref:lysine--tRNA ligase n=1 Tax=Dictyostelium firmibasis TaxID=79012 RepID=A0AAN7U2G5_9MYCE